jgi:hypothetical protein
VALGANSCKLFYSFNEYGFDMPLRGLLDGKFEMAGWCIEEKLIPRLRDSPKQLKHKPA